MRKLELKTAVSAVLAIVAGAVPLIVVPPFGDTLYMPKLMTIEVLVFWAAALVCAAHYRVFYREAENPSAREAGAFVPFVRYHHPALFDRCDAVAQGAVLSPGELLRYFVLWRFNDAGRFFLYL